MPSGVTSVTVNGIPAALDPQAGTWTLADVALTPGNKTLTVIATDTAGTQTTVTRTIIRDNQLPIVTITSPADNAITTEAAMTVTGTATDPGTGASGVDLVTVNGVQALFNHDSTFGTTATITGKAYDEGMSRQELLKLK